MHFIHWFREKGCSCIREEVDVCGCSPLDIRLKDFQETISVSIVKQAKRGTYLSLVCFCVVKSMENHYKCLEERQFSFFT